MAGSVPTPARGGSPGRLRSGRRESTDAEPRTGVRRTRRWRGVTGLTLVAIAVGLVAREPGLLLASVFGVGFAAYGQIGSAPDPTLAVERTVGVTGPTPGGAEAGTPGRVEAGTAGGAKVGTPVDRADGESDFVADGGTAGATGRGADPDATAGEPTAGSGEASEMGAVVDADPGDEVAVTLTVTNEGEDTLADLRLVDGVPDGLAVVEGSPRLATALRPGERATVTYAVEAARGAHEFGPAVAIARDATGATERVREVAAPGELVCVPELPSDPPRLPLRAQTTRYTGRTTADEGGTGVEFHATREYRPGDPLNQIDWKRTARTRDLTTVEYRLERAASVLLVVDARATAAVAPSPHDDSAVDRSVEAARRLAAGLLADGHLVGLATISPKACWLTPDRGAEHRLRLRRTLATHAAFARTTPEGEVNVYGALRAIKGRIADDTQIVFCSPLLDDDAEDAARRFEAHGHRTTVVSPDPTTTGTIGEEAAGVSRAVRVAATRRAGVPTVDWGPDEPIERALARTHRGRSP